MRPTATRTRLLAALALTLVSALFACSLRDPTRVRGPIQHVLLISIDSCRADHLGCYGHDAGTTPNIDALAGEGVLFENVISPTPQTLPAHSSMLTGTIPPYHGVHASSDHLDDGSNVTLAERLAEVGFTAGAIVGAPALDSQFGLARGFETYHDRFEASLDGNSAAALRDGDETTRLALDWLEANQDENFFLFLHYSDPHPEYEPPEPFASRFASNPYAGEIAYTDQCVGEVVEKLKELDLYDSTLIVVTSDHGQMLGEHGESTHGYFIYQSAIRVPLVFKVPELPEPKRVASLVGIVDIVPTVLGLLGVEAPLGLQGVDLSNAIRGEEELAQDRELYAESLQATKYGANSLLGIVGDRYKYIQTTRPELYDWVADPAESENLIEERVQRANAMQARLAVMLEEAARLDLAEGQDGADAETINRLKSLGYVAGSVSEEFSFDLSKEDPKDLLDHHLLHEQSARHLRGGDLDRAASTAERMIRDRPQSHAAYETLGMVAMARAEYAEAVAQFDRVVELDPDNGVAHYIRGLARMRGGRPGAAIADLNRAIELEPNRPGAYSERAAAHAAGGNHDQAILDYSAAIELLPDEVGLYEKRGRAYERRGDHDRAIADFSRVIEVDPDDAGSVLRRADAYRTKGDLERALDDYDEAIRLEPENAEAHAGRGVANRLKGEHDLAIRDYDRAIELDPDNARLYTNRGNAYGSKGETERAIRDYDRAIALDSHDAKAFLNRGVAFAAQGEYERAVGDFVSGLKLNPREPVAHKNAGEAFMKLGRTEEALRHYQMALVLKPDWPFMLDRLARILATHEDEEFRRGEDAVRLAEQACQLTESKVARTLDTLAAAYAEAGRFDEAVTAAEMAAGIAEAEGEEEAATAMRERAELYVAGTPYRESVETGESGSE